MTNDLIRREALLEACEEYLVGRSELVRKLIEEAPAADVTALAKELIARGSVVALFFQDKTGGSAHITALHGNSRRLIAALAAMWGSMAEKLPKKEIKRVEKEMRVAIRVVKKMVYKRKAAGGSADANGRV